jgi:predicted phage terminase large subunit-like protein
MLHLDDCASQSHVNIENVVAFISDIAEATAPEHGNARRLLREQSVVGFLDWGRKYLPHYFQSPPSEMHSWLAARLQQLHGRRGTKLNILAPRGAAKSTLVSLVLAIKSALEKSEPYIWIVSDTTQQSFAHLDNIKTELLENPRLAADYPAAALGPIWRRNLIVLRNGVAIEAVGTGQRTRGRRRRENRPTLIICDDLQNDGHIISALQRERSHDWFHGMLMKAGTTRTNVINVATALHRDAIAMELHRTPGWTSRLFQAIVQWPENMSLWHKWESIYTGDCPDSCLSNNGTVPLSTANQPSNSNPQSPIPNPSSAARQFYEQHRTEMDAGAVVLWPEVEDLYALMCMRVESGRTAFEREKQNSPINPDMCEWPESYFDESIWFETWPAQLVVRTMALDPSKGVESRRGDYSAMVVLGMDRQGMMYVEADLARRPTPEIVAEGVEWFRRFRPDAFCVEANQFQDLLAGEFELEFRRQGVLSARPVPIDNHVPKPVRIRRLGPHLSTRRLRFKSDSPGTKLLVEQLQQFPVGSHDDGPDALEMALRLLTDVMNGRAFNDGLGSRLWVG